MDWTVELIESAYVELLKLPHGRTRNRMQSTLCALRDELADLTGRDPQEIQDEFEGQAAI